MFDRRIFGVAVDAVRNPAVTERNRLPLSRGVAGGAGIASVVCDRRLFRVTRRTIDEASMVEPGIFPGACVVTVRALPVVVVDGCIFFFLMAVGAVVEPEVIEVCHVPVRRIGVTARAGVGVGVFPVESRGSRHLFESLDAHGCQVCPRCGWPLDGCVG